LLADITNDTNEEIHMRESTICFSSASDWWNMTSNYSLEEILLETQQDNFSAPAPAPQFNAVPAIEAA